MKLAFLDTETTGVSPKGDRIVEISIILMDGSLCVDTRTKRLNPGMPIPKSASDVHGITDADIKDCPTFKQVAQGIMDFIAGWDIVSYNGLSFDIPLLYNEFNRAGLLWDYKKVNFIDACNIFKINEPRTLDAAVKFYLGREHTGAHGAEADTKATAEVFFQQLDKYRLDGKTPAELALMSNYDKPILDVSGKFTTDSDGDIVFNFGKHKDIKAKTQKAYLNWMLTGDFSPDTKVIAKQCTFL